MLVPVRREGRRMGRARRLPGCETRRKVSGNSGIGIAQGGKCRTYISVEDAGGLYCIMGHFS